MPIRFQPVRPPQQRPTTPHRLRPRQRPALSAAVRARTPLGVVPVRLRRITAAVRAQLSRQLAQVLRRVRDGEAGDAEHGE